MLVCSWKRSHHSEGVTTVPVPSMGDSISEGTVVQWTKQPGDAVAADEVCVVLETDKVSALRSREFNTQEGFLTCHSSKVVSLVWNAHVSVVEKLPRRFCFGGVFFVSIEEHMGRPEKW